MITQEKKGTDCLEKEGGGQHGQRLPAEGSNKTATYVRFNVLEIFGGFYESSKCSDLS